jgi:hypothetical protein
MSNPDEMKERLEVTLSSLVKVVDPAKGGRWQSPKDRLIADAEKHALPHYPPGLGPWQSGWARHLDEPPLGYSIDAVPSMETVSGQPQPLLASPVAADAADVSS